MIEIGKVTFHLWEDIEFLKRNTYTDTALHNHTSKSLDWVSEQSGTRHLLGIVFGEDIWK